MKAYDPVDNTKTAVDRVHLWELRILIKFMRQKVIDENVMMAPAKVKEFPIMHLLDRVSS